MAVDDDQRGPILGRVKRIERAIEHDQIVRITNACDIPTEPDETCRDVVRVRERGIAFDGDMIVVGHKIQQRFASLLVTRERGGFAADAFHEVAVAADRVHAL